MNVGELIEELSKHPSDTRVVLFDTNDSFYHEPYNLVNVVVDGEYSVELY